MRWKTLLSMVCWALSEGGNKGGKGGEIGMTMGKNKGNMGKGAMQAKNLLDGALVMLEVIQKGLNLCNDLTMLVLR